LIADNSLVTAKPMSIAISTEQLSILSPELVPGIELSILSPELPVWFAAAQLLIRCGILHASESIVNAPSIAGTGSFLRAFERLEPYAGKLARTVLGGAEVSNGLGLPDNSNKIDSGERSQKTYTINQSVRHQFCKTCDCSLFYYDTRAPLVRSRNPDG